MIKGQLLKTYNELSPKSDKGTDHSYIEHYYDLEFGQYKSKHISLLEIGVQNGYSMNLWRNFFTPSLYAITGIDINITDEAKQINDEIVVHSDYKKSFGNFKLIQADAYSEELAGEFFNNIFDYIIDDGPHTLESQLKCIDLYYMKLNFMGGKLIIEDIQSDSDLQAIEDKLNAEGKTYKLYDLRDIKGRYDDILIEIIRKP